MGLKRLNIHIHIHGMCICIYTYTYTYTIQSLCLSAFTCATTLSLVACLPHSFMYMNGDIHSVPLSFCIQLRYDSQKDKGTLTKGVCIQLRYDSLSRCLSSSLVANGDIQTKGQVYTCYMYMYIYTCYMQLRYDSLSLVACLPLSLPRVVAMSCTVLQCAFANETLLQKAFCVSECLKQRNSASEGILCCSVHLLMKPWFLEGILCFSVCLCLTKSGGAGCVCAGFLYGCMYVYICIYTYICEYMCEYMYVYIYMYIYI